MESSCVIDGKPSNRREVEYLHDFEKCRMIDRHSMALQKNVRWNIMCDCAYLLIESLAKKTNIRTHKIEQTLSSLSRI